MVRMAPHLAHLFLVREATPDYGDAPTSDPFFLVREAAPAYGDAPTSDPFFLVREAAPAYGDAPTPYPFFLVREAAPAYGDAPTPDPFDDADALEELEEEVVTLAAQIHAATHRLLTLIAEFDHRRGWELGGHRTAAHWLSFRTGIDLGAAREKVRAARVLEKLPLTSASMARGELSFSKVRALTRVATAENEGDLVELARGCTASQLERMVRAFGRGSREDEAGLERERYGKRSFSVFPDDDGMYLVRGRLPAEMGALLMRAVEAASDALFREETAFGRGEDSVQAGAQRRADALGLLAERAMEAGFEKGPVSGTRAARYQVVLHVESEVLKAEGEAGRSELEDGTRVSAETSRRISCDAGVVPVRHAKDGAILDLGRKTRSTSPALRRALEIRDRGCRFPGCGLRFADAHHVRHWADGGETSLENCVLLCRHHHRLVHEGGWHVDWWGSGHPVFLDPRGGTHFEGRWRSSREEGNLEEGNLLGGSDQVEGTKLEDSKCTVETGTPVEALIEENRLRGANPDGRTAGARWEREADIPDRVYFRATEALHGAGP